VESRLPHLIGGRADEFAWILSDLPPAVAVCPDTGHTTLGQQVKDRCSFGTGAFVLHVVTASSMPTGKPGKRRRIPTWID
jgi:hypothetical protein